MTEPNDPTPPTRSGTAPRNPVKGLLTVACMALALASNPAATAAQTSDGGPATAGAADPTGAVIFLVRHAETAPDGTADPPLSDTGRARAAALAALLADAGLEAVLTSPYARTRETAAPVAAAAGVDVEEYDPRALAPFAERLRSEGRRVLVVGHSNTTPELVGLLGGKEAEPIAEDEHDRLYVVVSGGKGVRTIVLRYGGSQSP